MIRRFPAESAVPVAQSLLSPKGLQVGRQQPDFLLWLIRQDWAESVTNNKTRNRFELTPAGKEHLPQYMVSHYGDQWSDEPKIPCNRERFLKERLIEDLPTVIHSRVINAVWGEHSKRSIRQPDGITERNCEVIQLRTSSNVQLVFSGRTIDCREEMDFADAIILNEKMLSQFEHIKGQQKLHIMSIENAGAWQHMPLPDGLIAVHVPGNNQRLFRQLMDCLPETRWSHFGDLDPNGIQIAQNLAHGLNQRVNIFIPKWWYEYIENYQLSVTDSKNKKAWAFLPMLLSREYSILNRLKGDQIWLEQEAIMLDYRLEDTVKQWVKKNYTNSAF